MDIQDVQSVEVRKSLSDLLNQVAFSNVQYRITRHDKRVARLVSERLMAAVETLLKADDTLAETLELMLNNDLRSTIEAAVQEANEGKGVPLESILDAS